MNNPQIDPFYTQFHYEQLRELDGRYIGLVTFTSPQPYYPTQAIVKVVPFEPRRRNEGRNAIEMNKLTNVVQTYAYYIVRRHLVIFMRYYEESSLDKYLAKVRNRGGQLPEVKLLTMMRDIAKSVHSFHSNRLVHRDIKPHNIFLTSDLCCKLGDLELAKLIPQAESSSLQSTYTGTPAYMSPQRNARYAMHLAPTYNNEAFTEDIYALGKTFYEMCAGEIEEVPLPDARKSLIATVRGKVLSRKYSPQLADLIVDMMLRPLTANTVLMELEQLLGLSQQPLPDRISTSNGRAMPREPVPPPVPTIRCEGCKPRIPPSVIKLHCGHSYCSPCLGAIIRKHLSNPQTRLIEDISCTCDLRPIPLDFLRTQRDCITPDMLKALQVLEDLSQVGTCPCGRRTYTKVYHTPGLPPEPYVHTLDCECKCKICSWCGKRGGHKGIFSNGKCDRFHYYR